MRRDGNCVNTAGGDNLCRIYRAYFSHQAGGDMVYDFSLCAGCGCYEGDTTKHEAWAEVGRRMHAAYVRAGRRHDYSMADINYFDILAQIEGVRRREHIAYPALYPYPAGIDGIDLLALDQAIRGFACPNCGLMAAPVRAAHLDRYRGKVVYVAVMCEGCESIDYLRYAGRIRGANV